MTTSEAPVPAGALRRSRGGTRAPGLRAYFASDGPRVLQSVLGAIWLLDGALQFQSWMYSKNFTDMLTGMSPGQPAWLGQSINWAAHLEAHNMTVWNTLFAVVQLSIGLGLLYRPTVKPALILSFAWVFVVWWFGEGFGMLFMPGMTSPLTGAPGAVPLYALVGLIAWPNGRAGGLLGPRGARTMWATLWIVFAWLWLEVGNNTANAVTKAINAAPSGMSWLSTVQDWAARAARGDGLIIALVMAALCATIAVAVAAQWRPRAFLGLAIVLALAWWVFGQGLGGIAEGIATDLNSGPLLVLLAVGLWQLTGVSEPGPVRARLSSSDSELPVAGPAAPAPGRRSHLTPQET